MRNILGLFIFCLGISAVYFSAERISRITKPAALSKADSLRVVLLNAPDLIPHGDSGYVIKETGVRLMILNSLNDTSRLGNWDLIKSHAIIGKYYKDVSGDYIACMVDYSSDFETHLVMQIDPKGQLKSSQRFHHGNYACCWTDLTSGFRRYGRYYAISTCGTGSGHCSEYLYLFERLTPQDSINPILLTSFNAFGGSQTTLSGNVGMHDSIAIIHYTYTVKAVIPEKKSQESSKQFDMTYYPTHHSWLSPDSNKLDGLNIF